MSSGQALPVAGPGDPLACSRSLIREVAEKEQAALVFDVQTDRRFATAQSLLISGVRSLVAAPLLGPEGSLGMIVLDSRIAVRQLTEEDMELLVSLASVAALHLRNATLAQETVERRRFEEELVLARRIQLALLPDRLACRSECTGRPFPRVIRFLQRSGGSSSARPSPAAR